MYLTTKLGKIYLFNVYVKDILEKGVKYVQS